MWRVVDRLRGFLNLSYMKIKKIYIKKEFLKNSENPPQPSTKGGVNYKDRFQKNVTRRVRKI